MISSCYPHFHLPSIELVSVSVSTRSFLDPSSSSTHDSDCGFIVILTKKSLDFVVYKLKMVMQTMASVCLL